MLRLLGRKSSLVQMPPEGVSPSLPRVFLFLDTSYGNLLVFDSIPLRVNIVASLPQYSTQRAYPSARFQTSYVPWVLHDVLRHEKRLANIQID